MAEASGLWELLRQTADHTVVDALAKEVEFRHRPRAQPDQPARLRREHGLAEEPVIGALVHSARLGLFDLSWNDAVPGLRRRARDRRDAEDAQSLRISCSLCAADCEPTLDELVEVTFTVNPRVRRIAAHDPDTLPLAEYLRQIFWGSGVDLPDDVEKVVEEITLDVMELGPGEKAAMSLSLPEALRHRVRSRQPYDAVSRGRRRGDARAPQPVARLQRHARPYRQDDVAAGAGAHHFREPVEPKDDARALGRMARRWTDLLGSGGRS